MEKRVQPKNEQLRSDKLMWMLNLLPTVSYVVAVAAVLQNAPSSVSAT